MTDASLVAASEKYANQQLRRTDATERLEAKPLANQRVLVLDHAFRFDFDESRTRSFIVDVEGAKTPKSLGRKLLTGLAKARRADALGR